MRTFYLFVIALIFIAGCGEKEDVKPVPPVVVNPDPIHTGGNGDTVAVFQLYGFLKDQRVNCEVILSDSLGKIKYSWHKSIIYSDTIGRSQINPLNVILKLSGIPKTGAYTMQIVAYNNSVNIYNSRKGKGVMYFIDSDRTYGVNGYKVNYVLIDYLACPITH